MLKLKSSRGLYKLYLSRSRVFVAFAVALVVFGALALRETWAIPGEEPTLTLVSVSQYGEPITPVYDEYLINGDTWDWGADYYPVANNSDVVTLAIRVDGMADGVAYKLNGEGEVLTSQNNGQILYKDVRPYVSMEDSVTYDEYGDVESHSSWANEYHAQAYLENMDTSSILSWVNATLRPGVIGSSMLEILSVKQDGVDVVLDTTGRRVKDLDVMQTINEYQLLDFTKPVTITCKLKNLRLGWEYSGYVSNEYFHFVAESEEITDTITVNLNAVDKHTELRFGIYAYGPNGEHENSDVTMYFRIVDERFVPLGDVVIEKIRQGGVEIEPTVNGNTYTFRVNDVENITIDFYATSASESVTYHVARNIWSNNGASYHPTEWSTISGAELLDEASITIPARIGESEYSPFSLSIGIGMNENDFNGMQLYYGTYDSERWYGDNIEFEFYESETIPRYTLAYGYANYPDEEESAYLGMVDGRFHDEDNPLKVRIDGANYVDNQEYDININVKRGGENYYTESFKATGEQLNNGHTIRIDGLTLVAPEFDAETGHASIWSLSGNSGYDFAIEINGLEQLALGVFYQYPGWMETLITFADGGVNGAPGRNGMGGSPYVDYGYANLSSSAIGGEKNAALHYVGSGFEDDTTYSYALYFNGVVTEDALIGNRKLAEGTITGRELNDNALKVVLQVPNENSKAMTYDLVIKKGDKLVVIVRDEIDINDGPRIESFKINNDSADYTQTGKTSYKVTKDADVVGTLTGNGFDNDTTYRFNVEYGVFIYDERLGYSDYSELEDLKQELSLTGAELNNGFTHTVYYDERFAQEGVDSVEVYYYFPDYQYEYMGHAIHLRYVEPEEVQNAGDGFHIDENGEIQNDEHGDVPEEVPVDIRTPEDVSVTREGGTITVVSEKPVTVVGFRNGEWIKLYEWDVTINDEERTNHYSIGDCTEVKVVLKGDIDMRGSLNARDSARINYYLLSDSNPNHRDLSEIERLIADIDGNNKITARDASLLDYALLSTDNPNYRAISW